MKKYDEKDKKIQKLIIEKINYLKKSNDETVLSKERCRAVEIVKFKIKNYSKEDLIKTLTQLLNLGVLKFSDYGYPINEIWLYDIDKTKLEKHYKELITKS